MHAKVHGAMLRPLVVLLVLHSPLAQAQAVVIDRIAATVDARCITQSAVELRSKRGKVPREQALAELIEERLVLDEVAALGLTLSDDDVEAALAQVMAQAGLERAAFEKALAEQHYTLAQYRKEVASQLLQLKWLMIKSAEKGLPEGPEARAKQLEAERARLIAELKKKAIIEVRK